LPITITFGAAAFHFLIIFLIYYISSLFTVSYFVVIAEFV